VPVIYTIALLLSSDFAKAICENIIMKNLSSTNLRNLSASKKPTIWYVLAMHCMTLTGCSVSVFQLDFFELTVVLTDV